MGRKFHPESESPEPKGEPQNEETPASAEETSEPKEEPDWKSIALGYKTKVEEANSIRAEFEALKDRVAPPPAEPDDEEDVDMSAVEEWVNKGDAVAKLSKAAIKRQEKLEAKMQEMAENMFFQSQLNTISDPAEKDAVFKEFQANRNLYGDVNVARDALRARTQAKRIAELEKQIAKQSKPKEDVVRTEGRTAPSPPQAKEQMTYAQYDKLVAEARTPNERMAIQRRLRKDEIQITG